MLVGIEISYFFSYSIFISTIFYASLILEYETLLTILEGSLQDKI